MSRRWIALAAVVGILIGPAEAAAQPSPDRPGTNQARDLAKSLADRGYERLNEGKIDEAIDLFKRASEVYRTPTIVLFLARAYEKKGALRRAKETYESIDAIDVPPGAPADYQRARGLARTELDALRGRIPVLEIVLSTGFVAPVEVVVDDEVAAGTRVPVDPGSHRVRAIGADGRRAVKDVDVREGETLRVELEPPAAGEPIPAPGSEGTTSPLLIASIGFLAAGGLGLGASAVTGGLALSRAGELEDACPTRRGCGAEAKALHDDADGMATVSTATLIVGGLLAATGGTLLAFELGSSGSESTALRVGPNGIALQRGFQ